MSAPENLSAVEAAICDGTYSGFQTEAVALYRRIELGASLYDEPVDFAGHALDVGSRDGRHHSMIKGLGADRVTAIEPDACDIRRGVKYGVLQPEEVFVGTLEKWVADGHEPVSAAFVLNMLPRLAPAPEFLSALSRSVALGGLAVVSFIETAANRNFSEAVHGTPSLGLRQLVIPPMRWESASIQQPGAEPRRNRYLSIWRRE